MLTAVTTGKIYNGTTYSGRDKNSDRRIFRGRLNYRNNRGEYDWIDVVCFRDMGDKGGLVGWLKKHFSATEDNKGGQPIVMTGTIQAVKRKKPVEINGKSKGKPVVRKVETEYESFEFVIDTATFPPSTQKFSKTDSVEDLGDDFEFDEDDEDGDNIENDEAVEEIPEKVEKKKTGKQSKPVDDDDEFFED